MSDDAPCNCEQSLALARENARLRGLLADYAEEVAMTSKIGSEQHTDATSHLYAIRGRLCDCGSCHFDDARCKCDECTKARKAAP